MKDEEIIRKQAVELHLKSIPINDIADTLGKTCQWVHKWLKRYKTGSDVWYQSLSNALVSDYLFEKNNITFLKNQTREQFISALDKLEKEITIADNLLIFYAGHGYWNDVTQKGYWLVSDASKLNTANWIGNSLISDYLITQNRICHQNNYFSALSQLF